MKHLSKEEFSKRIEIAKEKTKYEYIFTGLEKQTDQILVKCLEHGYEQLQRREYVFGVCL